MASDARDGGFGGAEVGADDADALDALEAVVRHVGDELAFFRRRALDAERRLRDVQAVEAAHAAAARPAEPGSAPRSLPADLARIGALEAENVELRGRLAEAAERARAVASRLRFARQQDDAAAIEGLRDAAGAMLDRR